MKLSRKWSSRALMAALVLHNLEEAMTYQATRTDVARLMPALWHILLPTTVEFHIALTMVTLAGVGLLSWSAESDQSAPAWMWIKVVATILLANVLIPHLPLAIVLGGYAPGIISALFVNLPLCLWVLWRRGDNALERG